jgi:hypothetical protein
LLTLHSLQPIRAQEYWALFFSARPTESNLTSSSLEAAEALPAGKACSAADNVAKTRRCAFHTGASASVVPVEPVRSWRREIALAVSTDMNIEANKTFFALGILFFNYLLFSGRCWAFRLASAHGTAARAKTTAAWTFTDVAGGAETSTRHNCLRSGSQLMDRYSARRKSGREHRCEQEFSGHVSCSFGNAVFKDSVANPEVNRNAGAGFPGRSCAEKFETKAILELQLTCCYTH